MSVITKTGDKGKTKLPALKAGERSRVVDKDSQVVWTLGTIDELNSFLGIVKSAYPAPEVIEDIQINLFTISSIIGGTKLEFDESIVKEVEDTVYSAEKKLPQINNFVISSGPEIAAAIHYCRALARRAEREAVALNKTGYTVPENILIYLNRLSDLLFILMRLETINAGQPERIWKPRKKFTPLPKLIKADGIEGYESSELSKWFKDNEMEDEANEWFNGTTGAIIGGKFVVYTHDVERFLAGLPNID